MSARMQGAQSPPAVGSHVREKRRERHRRLPMATSTGTRATVLVRDRVQFCAGSRPEMPEAHSQGKTLRDPLIGRLLHERYKVEKRIGKGGMGIVYLAEHVLLKRKVALKTLSDRAFASEEAIARFHREAVAAAAVGNEHVVGVTDMGQLDDGTFYVALEYLEGVELGREVDQNGPLAPARAVAIALQLCDALTAVHEAGIVHRDLKPENLFLIERKGTADFVKVLDFGVCKLLDGALLASAEDGSRPLTHTYESLGTPQFMSPEQIEGAAAADARTDVYATGAILYFALTGQAPFDDTTLPRLFMRICSEPPPPLRAKRPELPPALEAVILRAMERDPSARYQSAEELRQALLPFAPAQPSRPSHEPRASEIKAIAPRAVAGAEQVLPDARKRRAVLAVLAALGVLAALAAASAVIDAVHEEQAKPIERAAHEGRAAEAASAAPRALETEGSEPTLDTAERVREAESVQVFDQRPSEAAAGVKKALPASPEPKRAGAPAKANDRAPESPEQAAQASPSSTQGQASDSSTQAAEPSEPKASDALPQDALPPEALPADKSYRLTERKLKPVFP